MKIQKKLNSSPIFIVGMPRSGTTLIEQILASHSQMTAGDETQALPRASELILVAKSLQQPFPLWLDCVSHSDMTAIADTYRQLTRPLQKTAFFTDKTLLNFKAIGLIFLIFPNAKIIHCQRNPMDNIFSCYKQIFASGLDFTYELDELTEQFILYRQLMNHWKECFGENILTLQYEDLIQNQSSQTRRLLDYLDLPFEENCLSFFHNDRSVHTLSANQVKKPLYTIAIDSWKNYAAELNCVFRKLNETGMAD